MLQFDSILGILGAAFLFGFAVFIHELGHFTVAKWLGVGVKKFAIGFGPKITSIVRGGTEYSLRWIPLGGFVSLKGAIDDEEEEAPEDKKTGEPQPSESAQAAARQLKEATIGEGNKIITEDLDALRNKPPLARIAVFVAGVTCNYLTAIVFMGILLWYGMPKTVIPSNVIEEIPSGTRLYDMGWRSGDRILAVDGKRTKNWNDVQNGIEKALVKATKKIPRAEIKEKVPSLSFAMTVAQPDGTTRTLTYPMNLSKDEKMDLLPSLSPRVAIAEPNSPADRAQLISEMPTTGALRQQAAPAEIQAAPAKMKRSPIQAGDLIVAINDKPIKTWHQMEKVLQKNADKEITVTVERGKGKKEKILKLAVTPEKSDTDPNKGRLGVWHGETETGERERASFGKAFASAPVETVKLTYLLITTTYDFIAKSSWRETQRNLGGPVAITIMAYKSVQQGLSHYLELFIAVSIILAFMNVLPIPILDGGYIAITIVEAIIRRPIPRRVLEPVLTFFMFLFIIFFIFLFYNDFRNWIFKF